MSSATHALLEDANDMLRSAYSIALRDGANTNWSAFKMQLERVLVEQSWHLYGTTHLPAAIATPKTFRQWPGESP